jgi:hypothetical protein
MPLLKKNAESDGHSVRLAELWSERLDQCCRFAPGTPDGAVRSALRKILSRDPQPKKSRAARSAAPEAKAPATSRSSPGIP